MAISTLGDLSKKIELSKEERLWFEKATEEDLSFLVPTIFENKLEERAIRVQFVPSVRELDESKDSLDPQCEEAYTVLPHLVHRYKNRVAFTVSDKCFGYCRHCFRRRFTSNSKPVTKADVDKVASYIKSKNEIEEILITGGDPLTLSNGFLDEMFCKLRQGSPSLIIRLCTRALSSLPSRFDEELLSILKKHNNTAPLYVITQFNSEHEFTEETEAYAKKITEAGCSIFNQSVLLKGVNDDIKAIKNLSRKLLLNRIKPYYIFQGDDVKGTEHLRLSLEEAFALEEAALKELSGLEMPVFMKDLPEGGGKLPLSHLKMRMSTSIGSDLY